VTPAAFLTSFAEAVASDGALVLLVLLILFLGARKTWVFGYQLERIERLLTDERVRQMGEVNEMRSERDSWRRIALIQSGHPNPEGHPRDESISDHE
jgi:uncharacterized membrane protein